MAENIRLIYHTTFAPITGCGGVGSGHDLPEMTPEQLKQRTKIQTMNAQRVYRDKDRSKYNANMQRLYKKIMEEKGAAYQSRISSTRKANAKYRDKKRITDMIASKESIISKELESLWSQRPKSKGRPKKNAPKTMTDSFAQENLGKARGTYESRLNAMLQQFKTDYGVEYSAVNPNKPHADHPDYDAVLANYNNVFVDGKQKPHTEALTIMDDHYDEKIRPKPSKKSTWKA